MSQQTAQGFRLSPQQERICLLRQAGDGLAFVTAAVARIDGEFDGGLMRRAVADTAVRHDVLRTSLQGLHGLKLPVQLIADTAEIAWHEGPPLAGSAAVTQQAAVEELLGVAAGTGFDLEQGPRLLLTVVELAPAERLLAISAPAYLTDAAGMRNLLRQIGSRYEELLAGVAGGDGHAVSDGVPLSYAVISEWLHGIAEAEESEMGREYWRRHRLLDFAEWRLPLEKGEAQRPFAPAAMALPLAAGRAAAYAGLADDLGVSLPALLLTAWLVLLRRLSGAPGLVVGTAADGRTDEELAAALGLLARYLPVGGGFGDAMPFAQAVQSVDQTLQQNYEWQECFRWELMNLGREAVEGSGAFFPFCFDFDADGTAAGNGCLKLLAQRTCYDRFRVRLSCTALTGRLALAIHHDTNRFDEAAARRLGDELLTLLDAVCTSPQTALGELELVSGEERRALLSGLRRDQGYESGWRCLDELVTAQAAANPEAVAVIYESRRLSYADLDAWSNRLAHRLRRLGVDTDVAVGLFMERSLELAVALLGILKAGGAYLPLDPIHPRERTEAMLRESRAPVVLTQPELRERLPAGGMQVVALEDEPSALAAELATAPRRRAAPESLAYVLFTSGSTGTPKAVMIPHRAAVNHMLWMQDEFPLTAADRVLQKTAFTFDASVWELFAPLCAGAGLVMARPGGQRDPAYLAQVIAEQGITVLQLVPSQLRSLLDEGILQGATGLRQVFCGGEALDLDLAARFLEQVEAPLINLYGPAEATIEVTSWRCDAGDGRRSVPLGRPIANVEIRVLDDRLRLVPLGARGELYVGGLAPGRGYLGRPELTAERFLPDPFATQPGSRLYRSGDLAAVQPDLTIEYFGRADHQVKVRGFRIELGEVEATLARHPAVREGAVTLFETAAGDRLLTGYYTTVRGQAATPAELREFLLAKLPDYMVPASLVELPAMPLTPSGKIDRRALPAPVSTSDLEAPRGLGEQLMSELWAEVLSVDRVGIHSSFFEIGGHSLIATRLISRIRQVFQVELPLRSIFESPTVAGLLRQVEAVARSGAGLETPPILPVPRGGGEELPLSFAQQRLWFLDQLQPASPVYNIAEALGVEGPLDVRALASAFSEICRRHESLRTSFPVREGRPAQAIAPPAPLPLPVVDLCSLPVAVRPAAAKRLAAGEALRPFRLERGPLLRVTLLRLAPAEHQVLVTMHHIASDGWSLQILVREVAALYRAAAGGLPSPLQELPVQYADFAHWQRHWLRGEILARHVDYWRGQLADAQAVLDLPTDRPRPATLSLRGARVATPLPAELAAAMAALARARRVTLFMALLAGFQALMHRYSGQQDVLVGSPVANRTRVEIEGLIGFFVNTLVLRLGFQGDPSGEELLERVREAVLGAIAHQDLPFEKLVEELQPQRAASHSPLFQVMFALENAPREVVVTPRLGLFPLGGDTATAKFDLTLNIAETPQGLVAALEYSTDLFDGASAWRMLAHFAAWLTGLAAQPAWPIGEISLLTAAERFQLLAGWNDTELRRDEEATLHGLFAARAVASPDALAAVFDGRSLTYRELDRHANCLAHRLRALGVGPEVLVALSLPRSLELMVALLGVLKAGGAYLPLDPSYPAERLAGMMEDARATVVIHLPGDAEVPAAAGTRRVELAPLKPAAHLGRDGDEEPRSGVLADNPAYVIFTSGSTGRPKGAMNTHRAICNRLLWVQEALPLNPGDRILQKSPLGFDVSVWELFWPLVAGGCVVLARPEGHLDPAYIADTMAEQRISVVHFVPSMLRIFLEQERLERCVWLRWVICGGEAVPVDLAARCIASLPARFYDLYGPTEAAIDVTFWGYRPDEASPAAGAGSVPIGRPISNARLFVVDRELRPVPVGVAGELYLAGVAPARGYVHQPALTAERFLPDPWSGVPGARAYRTGDLVRYLADGAIEFLGRIDNQVKVHGFRMELGEVEAVLGSHPGVQAAAVAVVRGAAGDARLVGYVVPRAAATPGTDGPSAEELGRHLRLRLPEPMVPVTYVTLAAMPLTLSGKIDRRALPPPRQTLTGSPAERVLPRTAAEATLARIWSEVLRLEQVAVDDNFFEIGGDSILSIQIVARASAAGLHITPRQMFQHQTVAELAAAAATVSRVHLEQEPVTGEAPLLPIQHWFFSLGLEIPEHFNQSLLLRPLRPLPPARLDVALEALVAHHDALRLRFRREDDGWRQLFAPPAGGARLVRVDLSGLPEAKTTAAVEQAATALQLGFDLRQGPLFRVAHLELAETDSRLLFCVHHLLVDGVSWRILLDDLATAAAQLERGEPIQLPARTTSLKRWAARLTEHVAAGGLRHQAAYWLETLPVAARRLPADWSDGADSVAGAETLTVTLDAAETHALLREVPRAYGSHVEEALLTGLAQGLAAWTGSAAALIDLEGHGREEIFGDVDLSRTVGWFTTLYPVALDLAGCAGPGDALKRVKEQLRRVPDRGLGYGMLRYLAPRGPEPPPLAACPCPEVVFNYLGQIDQALDPSSPFGAAAERVAGLRHPQQQRQHRLEVTAGVSSGCLWLSWTYGREVFRRATVERLADAVSAALRTLIDHCREAGVGGFTPSDFPLAHVEQAVLDRWAAAGRPLEDLYALSPLQEGLLYHALSAPGSDAYFQQLSCTLRADLDRTAFDRAWREVIDLHPALRTSFSWREVDPPLQVVESGVELPVEALDWRALPPAVQQEWLRSLRLADRERGFDLTRAPLMRLCLVRLAADTYELVWSFHHLLFDGWSLPRVVRQVFTAYAELRSGDALRLPRPRPYRDYIAWLMQQDQDAAEQFWRREMAGWQGPTAIGSRAAAPARREDSEPDWQVLDVELSVAHSAALAALARRSQVSLNTVIQGAWAALLSRYSGEREVLFGVTSSGRSAPVPGIEEMVGVFINTLPLRVEVTPTAQLAGWLRALQARQAEARQFEYCSLADIQTWAGSTAGEALFETLLIFENYPVGDSLHETPGALEVLEVDIAERTTYPLTLLCSPGERMPLRLAGDPRRFERVELRRSLEHLCTLLAGMTEDAEGRRLADLTLLTAAERQQLLVAWNDTEWPRDPRGEEITLHGRIAKRAAACPDALAAVCEGRSLTFRELERQANRLAHRLRSLGVGPEVVVAVSLPRSLELVVGLLGVLKAGGAYLPLDPAYPRERQAAMVEDARAAVLLHMPDDASAADWQGLLKAAVELPAAEVDGGLAPPADGALADNPAYVIFTSGSTGRPKGAVNTHRAICNVLDWMQETYGLEPGERVLQKTPVGFDVSVWELFWPLVAGGCLVLARPGGHLDSSYLIDTIVAEQVTTVHFVPAMLRTFLDEERVEQCRGLRRVISIGEALPLDLAARCTARLAGGLHNLYGPTEAAVQVTAWAHQPDAGSTLAGAAATVPIGRPISNTRLYVVDREFGPVPTGAAGELFIAGVALARGYAHQPALTAERFIPEPWSGGRGERAYRTGDLVRYLADGAIEFLGRIDSQVKVHGVRIELGEIEAALVSHPEVQVAAVIARSTAGETPLVGYVVPRAGAAPSPAELSRHLRRWLPEAMVPGAYVILAALPLTASGKLDRRALPSPESEAVREDARSAAPRDLIAGVVAAIWCEVLGLPQVDERADFFALGGHSLTATRVISRLRKSLNVELPLRDLFEYPTVAALAARIELARRSHGRRVEPPVQPAPRDQELPLSFAQERLWFIDQFEPGSPAYNLPAELRLRGPLQVPHLAAAMREVVRRHEVLRTRFPSLAGRPVQVVAPPGEPHLSLADLSALPPALRAAEGQRQAAQEMQRPFDLAQGPVVRTLLVRLAEGDHLLVVNQHHIASDGWSMGVLIGEVSQLYAAAREGRPSPLPELAFQYADLAVWQREWLRGEVLAAEIDYWRQRLAGAPELLALPTDRPRPAVVTYHGDELPLELSPRLTERLRALGQAEGATLFMTLIAGLQALLSRYSGQQDLIVSTTVAGRNRVEAEPLIGVFVNFLLLRADLSSDPSFRALLAQGRETALEAHAHQDLPFERLVEELLPQRSMGHTPLFQVVCNLLNLPVQSIDSSDLTLIPMVERTRTAKFELVLDLVEGRGGMGGRLEYNTDLFDSTTAARLVAHFTALLEGAVADPWRRLIEVPLLAESERAQALREWNDTAEPLDPQEAEATIHSLFERQVKRAGASIAVVAPGETLDYAELDRRTNRLARQLRALGVRRGTLVGIYLRRSARLVAAPLAVLKAGGAYVPLEPAWPAERVRWIVRELGLSLLVTEASCLDPLTAGAIFEARPADVLVLDAAGAGGREARAAGSTAEDGTRLWWEEDRAALSGEALDVAGGGPEDLAYLIFTSGSTGRPKGVLVRHAPVVNLIGWVGRNFGVGPADRGLFITALSFDLSVYDIFGLLAAGGSVRVASDAEVRDPEALARALREEPVTFWDSAPAALQQVVPFLGTTGSGAGKSRLRLAFLSGDWIPLTLAERLRAECGEVVEVVGLGGATEAVVWSNFYRIGGALPGWTSVPYGRPIANARYHVLDRPGEPCPVGVAGDLFIGGQCLAAGYGGEAALTAERFLPDPFGSEPGGRLYRTGDRARYRADGHLEFLGRLDSQIKIRGFRIELGEIEAVLAQHPAVREAVALAPADAAGNRSLTVYAVLEPEIAATAAELREHLARAMPDPMVPAKVTLLPALPLTANGKLDRAALSRLALAAEPHREQASQVLPRTPLEEVLASVWSEVLRREEIAVDDDFFELGGHSLLATQVVSRLRGALGAEVPVRLVFELPTIAAQAARLAEGRRSHLGAAPPISPATPGQQAAAPLSYAQQRLWLIDQLEPGSPAYNMFWGLRLSGDLHIAALQASLTEVVARHASLRTTFFDIEGRPLQVVAPPGPPEATPLPVIDLSGLPEERREAAGAELAGGFAGWPFDLRHGPLLRLALLRLDDSQHLGFFMLHHIVGDAWSMGILVTEVAALYAAALQGRASPLPALEVQYPDFAQWQRRWLDGPVRDILLGYWRRKLAGGEPAQLEPDYPRLSAASHRGGRHDSSLSREMSARLGTLARGEHATVFMVLVAALQGLLHRIVGQDRVWVGIDIANRNQRQTEGLIGFLLNQLVIATDLSGDPSFRGLLGRVREVMLEAYDHQDLPFDLLVEDLQPARLPGRTPLLQVKVAHQNAPLDQAAFPGLAISGLHLVDLPARFDLTLLTFQGEGGIEISWIYRADLFAADTIRRLADQYVALLEGAAADLDARLAGLDLLSETEKQRRAADREAREEKVAGKLKTVQPKPVARRLS